MCGKNKCLCAVLVEIVLSCLLSACTVNGNGTDMESQKANDSVEHELSSEGLPSETDSTGQQVTDNTSDEQSGSTTNNQAEIWYKAILLGNGDFVNIDRSNQDRRLNIENIKEVVSDEDWVTAKITKFTIIDLDGNGENEIVLWIQANEDLDYGFEILYYQDQEVYGFTLPYRGFLELKTDGTFDTAGGIEDSEDYYGVGRLRLFERRYTIEDASDSGSQEGKTNVEWYDLTPDSVELAFEKFMGLLPITPAQYREKT